MLDIGWTELMVIGMLALLVVGPKELPRLLRTVGQFVGKARGMARDFQRSMEDAAREADLNELTDLKRDIDKMGRVSFKEQAKRSSSSLTGPAKKQGTAAKKAGDAPAPKPASGGDAPAPPAESAQAESAKAGPGKAEPAKAGPAPAPERAPKAAPGET